MKDVSVVQNHWQIQLIILKRVLSILKVFDPKVRAEQANLFCSDEFYTSIEVINVVFSQNF
jgi:hypothetical protein